MRYYCISDPIELTYRREHNAYERIKDAFFHDSVRPVFIKQPVTKENARINHFFSKQYTLCKNLEDAKKLRLLFLERDQRDPSLEREHIKDYLIHEVDITNDDVFSFTNLRDIHENHLNKLTHRQASSTELPDIEIFQFLKNQAENPNKVQMTYIASHCYDKKTSVETEVIDDPEHLYPYRGNR